ncbi:uncharacterized protein involved in exopolysaccharide biosynthesis [Pedobacter sp. UYEF25]
MAINQHQVTNKGSKVNSIPKLTVKQIFSRFWAIYAVLLILAIVCSWLYIRIKPSIYRATAEIFYTPKSKKGSQPILEATKSITANLSLYAIVEQLSLCTEVYSIDKLAKRLLYRDAPIAIKVQTINTLKTFEHIPFRFSDYLIEIGGKGYPFNKWVMTPYGELMFLRNALIKQNNEQNYDFSLLSPKEVIESLSNNITVMPAANASHLNISLTDKNPVRATAILNGVITAFTRHSSDAHNVLAVNTAKFINNQLEMVEAELLMIEPKLKANQIGKHAAPENLGREYLENVDQTDGKLSELSVDLLVLDRLKLFAESTENKGGLIPSNVGIEDSTLTQIVKSLYKTRANLLQLDTESPDKNKALGAFESQMIQSKQQLENHLKLLKTKFTADINTLSFRANGYSSLLDKMPEIERNLVYVKRQHQIKTNVYTFLLKQKEKTSISYVTDGADRKIIKPAAASSEPANANHIKIFLTAIIAAIVMGFGYTKFRALEP